MRTTLLPPFATASKERDQAMIALAEANRVRLRRASLMRWMQARSSVESHEKAAELILEPDQALDSMLVLDLLDRVRQVGASAGRADARLRRHRETARGARGAAAPARRIKLSQRTGRKDADERPRSGRA
jgi:hypothetical protein